MDIIIVFFRDILSGPLYIIIAIVNSILICSCIGYMGEQYLNKKKQKEINNVNDFNISSKVDNSLDNLINVSLGSSTGNVGSGSTMNTSTANLVNSNNGTYSVNNTQNSNIQ